VSGKGLCQLQAGGGGSFLHAEGQRDYYVHAVRPTAGIECPTAEFTRVVWLSDKFELMNVDNIPREQSQTTSECPTQTGCQ